MANLRPEMFALLGTCLLLVVNCKAEYPVYHYQDYYPNKYYRTYNYKYDPTHTHSVVPFKSYPVYHTGDYFPHKGTHYDPHADYHVYPYSGWAHHQPYTYDHDWYGYQGHAPVYRPAPPLHYPAPYLNVYNQFAGGVTSQRSDAKADASSTAGAVGGSGGGAHTAADESAESSGGRSREAPAGPPPRSRSAPGFAPRVFRQPAAAAAVALPASLREAWRSDPAGPGPQSDAAWNFVAGDSPAAARWFPRSGYKHIDQVRPKAKSQHL